jgi:putative heme-binding domain-containing protein
MIPFLFLSLTLAGAPAKGLSAPAGFEITEFSDSTLANDITCMTIDPQGRVVVAGRGYIRLLLDDKEEGRASKAVDIVQGVKEQAMGLFWEGDSLYAVVDGGLWRWHIGKDAMTADRPPERIRSLRTSGEHHAHAIRRGPDGWFYLLVGDSTGIDERFATLPTSLIKKPIGGCLLRLSPDFKQSEIVADGFRNPYGFDFDLAGDVWTFDSDNERCVSLPWYEPTRVYRITPGGHYGWRAPQLSDTWRCPPYFVDVASPIVTAGRGSPTGVVVYKHTAWPIKQRGLLLADWTFGKVWRYQPNAPNKLEPFIRSEGDTGFAPTAMAVHPKTGDLFISIGGRGTRGAVYRVHWNQTEPIDPADTHERREPIVNSHTGRLEERLRPPEELQPKSEFGVEWKNEYLNSLPQLAISLLPNERRLRALVEIRRHHAQFPGQVLANVVRSTWGLDDSQIVTAIGDLISILPADQRQLLLKEAQTPWTWIVMGLGLVRDDPAAALDLGTRVLELDNTTAAAGDADLRLKPEWRLRATRLIQLALGDLTAPDVKASVWAGYTSGQPLPPDRHPRVRQALRSAFPSGISDLDRELSRTLAMLEDDDPTTLQKVVARLTPDSDPLDDVHYLIVASRSLGSRSPQSTSAIADALLRLDEKIVARKRNRDRNWPLRIAELHSELARKDAHLNDAILNNREFGRPDHALFKRCPGFDRRAAAMKFIQRAARDKTFEWNSELVVLIGELPPDVHLPILRKLAARGGLDDAILPVLARSAEAGDLSQILTGLTSPRLDIVRLCLIAIAKISPPRNGPTLFAIMRCLRLLPDGKEGDRLRDQISVLLESMTGEKFGRDRNRWSEWFRRGYPDLAKRLGGADGVDIEGWNKRLAKIDWSSGDASRGRAIFGRASCAACHSGSQAMGPDLSGISNRFSRDDVFTAILQPSKDIAPRYRMTQIETADGHTYQGLIVYEAVDSLLLQTGPAQTVRIAGDQIESKRLTDISLMPVGLLDKLTDAEIADLYSFLRSLGKTSR